MFLNGLSSFNNSTSAGKVIFAVVNLSQASVQLTSSRVRFICGCSPGGTGLSLLQEIKITVESNAAVTNNDNFILSPKYFNKQSYRVTGLEVVQVPAVKEP